MGIDILTQAQSEILSEQATEIVLLVACQLCQLRASDRFGKMIGDIGVYRKDEVVFHRIQVGKAGSLVGK